MNRYANYGPRDDETLPDGDRAFLGMVSRYHPTELKEGMLHYSGNGRMDRGTWKVRAGLAALSTDISLTNPPLIVGAFSLATSYAVTSITRSVNTATVTTTVNNGYATADRINIRGAVQTDYNGDYTIATSGTSTFTYTVANTPATPATGTILANRGPRVYNNYASQAVGSGDYADSATNTEGIVICSTTTAYLYRYGVATITISYPANETCAIGDPCCLVQFLNNLYLFRGYSTAAIQNVTSITQAAGLATVTSTAHGLATNSWVTIVGASPDGYNGIVQITSTGANTYTYACSAALASPATGTITARPCKPPLYWDLNVSTHAFAVVPTGPNIAGAPLIKMPAADWGMFFKSRMVVPWSRDQLILSDFLGANSYDPSQTQFRILPGTNDWIVAAFPYQLARLLVLYRKSVHAIYLDGTTLAIAGSYDVTRNFGCVARRSVANCGPSILWLSDLGVMQMSVNSELTLQNTTAPLSDPIQDIIAIINWTYAANSVATFWNNRYYLAIPTGTSAVNNTVLVYNFLNTNWESVDTYPLGWDALNFHIISYNGTKRIFAVSTYGYVTLLEQNNYDQFGAPGNLQNIAIAGDMQTRNYLCDIYDMKKFRRFQLDGDVTSGDAFAGSFITENPDTTLAAVTYTATATNGITLRVPVRRRGISGRIELTTSAGRPEIHSFMLETTITSRTTTNYT